MLPQRTTKDGQDRCRRRRECQRKKIFGAKSSRSPLVLLVLTFLVLGTLIPGKTFALAETSGNLRSAHDERTLEDEVAPDEEAPDEEAPDETVTIGVDNDGNTTDILAPGDNEVDSGDRLPFLTDEDVQCLDATAEFRKGDAGLESAVKTFESAQVLKEEDSGVEVLGYPGDAVDAMKAACGLKKGHWAFVKTAKFTCVIEAMETVALHAHNFGSCLAKTDECIAMDSISILRADLVDLGFNCWEDEEADGDSSAAWGAAAESTEGSDENDEEKANIGEDDEDTDSEKVEGGDAGGAEKDTNTTKVENDQEGEDDTDPKNDEDKGADDASEIFDALGLSESDQQCMTDSLAMSMEHPELEQAVEEYSNSIDVTTNSATEMDVAFSDEFADTLKLVCGDIDAYFSVIEEQDFVCDMMSVEVNLQIRNIANCLAGTDECKSMNPLLLLEDLWKSLGLTCKKKTAEDTEDSSSSTTNTTKPGDSNKKDDPFFKDLTESEIGCMSDSTALIDSSEDLANATAVYQKSVIMSDPTRWGYTTESAAEMEQVCEEQGGVWAFIKTEDVTCTIKGRDRCMNVYNFGNCIADSDDCQSMDAFVLVRGFFLEVLTFDCKKGCDTHPDKPAGHSPSSAPHKNSPYGHTNNDNNLSSQQSFGNNSGGGGSKLPSFATGIIVVGVVGAVGLFGYFRYRASTGRESARSYEMTDISDLGFEVFT